jgi:hypothetical protein
MQKITLTFRKTTAQEIAAEVRKHGEKGREYIYASDYHFNKELCQTCEQKLSCLVGTPCEYRNRDGYTVFHKKIADIESILNFWKTVFKEI